MGKVFENPENIAFLSQVLQQGTGMELMKAEDVSEDNAGAANKEMIEAMMRYTPLRSLAGFMGLPEEVLEMVLRTLNQQEENTYEENGA